MTNQLRNNSEHDHTQPCKVCQQYYGLGTLANMLDVSQKTLRRMITEGRLKAKRIGGSIRIPHSELQKLIREY